MSLLTALTALNPFKARTANKDSGIREVYRAVGNDPRYLWPDLSKPEVQLQAYRANPFLYATVNKIVTSAAAVSMEVYNVAGEEKEEIEDHPIERLLAKPNVLESYQSLIKATLTYLLVTGNAYWYIAGGFKPTEVYNIRSDRVWIVPGTTPQSPVAGYVYRLYGQDIPLEEPQVIHFKLLDPANDFYGLSPVYTLWKAIQTDQAMAQWNMGYFGKNNAVPSSIVSMPPTMSDPDFNRVKREWVENYGGDNPTTAFIRGDQIKLEVLTPTHEDMAFLDGRAFNRETIERVYGIAGGLSDKSATRANSDSAYTQFLDEVVYPHMNSIAELLTVRLAPIYGDNLCVEAEDIRQKDNADERAEIEVAKQFFTVNEIRKLYFQEQDIEGGDVPSAVWNSAIQAAPQTAPDASMPMDAKPPELPAPPQVPQLPPGDLSGAENKALDEEDRVFPALELTASMKRQLQQFVTLVGKDKPFDGFEFHQAPYSLELMAKSWADTMIDTYAENAPIETYQSALAEAMHYIRLLDPRHTIKAEQRGWSMSGKRDELAQEKDSAESAMLTAMSDYLTSLAQKVIKNVRQAASSVRKSGIPGSLEDYTNYFDDKFWNDMLDLLDAAIRPIMHDNVTKGATAAADRLSKFGIGLDPTQFNTDAASYALKYTDKVLRKFNDTTRDGVGAVLGRWIGSEGATLGDLVTALEQAPLFSLQRATLTAITETTRAFSQGEMIAGEELATLADVPMRSKGSGLEPPLHPGCRCWITVDPVYDTANHLVAMDTVFHTSQDTVVCPICAPYNDKYLSGATA